MAIQIALLIGAAAGGFALWAWNLGAKRREALAGVAVQAGWSYTTGQVKPRDLGMGAFRLFSAGSGGRADHVMRGSEGRIEFAVFDFRYTVSTGKQRHTVAQTAVHLRSSRLALPPFVLSPENVFHKIGGFFGYRDIDFDESPAFSGAYLLRAKGDEQPVRDVFNPVVRAFFEQQSPMTVEAAGDEVLVYRGGHTVKPEDIRELVDRALAIARHFE